MFYSHLAGRWSVFATLLVLNWLLVLVPQAALAADDPHAHHRADAQHASHSEVDLTPIGVMGAHVHHKGGMMVSYRYMRMHMDGNRDGTSRQSQADLFADGWRAAPNDMDMDMHMLGFMYAPLDNVTLMLMLPIVQKTMDLTAMMGSQDFTTKSSGLGDISATALIKVWEKGQHGAHLNLGLGFPSGSINRKDKTPKSAGENEVLPYPMQAGSGSFSFLPAVTYNGHADTLSWGGQARATIRLDKNKEHYRLGNDYALTAWGGYEILEWLSGGLRLQYEQRFNITSRDSRITGAMAVAAEDFVPTADPKRRAGKRLELGPSVNLLTMSGPLAGVRLGVEAMFPLYRSLDGPQLETDWTLTAGVQYAF